MIEISVEVHKQLKIESARLGVSVKSLTEKAVKNLLNLTKKKVK